MKQVFLELITELENELNVGGPAAAAANAAAPPAGREEDDEPDYRPYDNDDCAVMDNHGFVENGPLEDGGYLDPRILRKILLHVWFNEFRQEK